MKKDVNKYVDDRLELWADWYIRIENNGLGYPNKTMEQRLKEHGGLFVKSIGPKIPPSNHAAEEVEEYVSELFKQNSLLATVLRKNYFEQNTAARKAKQLGISTTQFRVQLAMAKQWMAGRLSSKKNKSF